MSARSLLAGVVAAALLAGAARAETIDELLVQARDAKDAAALKPIEARLRILLSAEDTDRLAAALVPPHVVLTPLVLDLLDAKCRGPAAVEALKRLSSSPPAWYAAAILRTRCRMGDAEALQRLQDKSDDATLKPADRNEYVRALCELALKSDPDVRRETLKTLGSLRLEAGLETLLIAMADAEPAIRDEAAASLKATMASLFPYVWLDLKAAGYEAKGGTDEGRRKAIDAIRAYLAAAKVPLGTPKPRK